ncbi:hypothetical protein NUW54_g1323 [Trametes sanguinea]|uniref:Uncharacterized protein n=1 Tax=Trametes sanguinea TaxID=158606 RepID=A0ACC1Q840_9APHY|nr:hypothetical protein NUW54_g1323 [Trametes sanguinea]
MSTYIQRQPRKQSRGTDTWRIYPQAAHGHSSLAILIVSLLALPLLCWIWTLLSRVINAAILAHAGTVAAAQTRRMPSKLARQYAGELSEVCVETEPGEEERVEAAESMPQASKPPLRLVTVTSNPSTHEGDSEDSVVHSGGISTRSELLSKHWDSNTLCGSDPSSGEQELLGDDLNDLGNNLGDIYVQDCDTDDKDATSEPLADWDASGKFTVVTQHSKDSVQEASALGSPHGSGDSSSDESDGAADPRPGQTRGTRVLARVEDFDNDNGASGGDEGDEHEDKEHQPVDNEDVLDVTEDDPLYACLQDLVAPDSAGDPRAASYTDGHLPRTFSEDPLVRRAYIQAFIAAAFHSATHDLRTGFEIPGLDDMVRTLRTVERRLGVDPDEHIIYYALGCTEPGCKGKFYEVKTSTNGKQYRMPLEPLPTTSLIAALQRILLRPGKVSELGHWRKEHKDDAGPVPPRPQEEWPGLQHRKGGKWGFEDITASELLQRFVALPMGLVLMFNIDWFCGLKRSKYSAGAIYCTLCNNPRAKRFLREETILLAVIPGPEEPSLEQLNAILEVFVLEARHLYDGILMRVPGSKDPQPCHVYVNIIAADLPGSWKATGLRGHTAQRFMCMVCKKTFHINTVMTAATSIDLNILPDWMPARDSPPDFMHAGYLGEAKHVVQGILIKGGMFTKRSNRDKPDEKFKGFLEDIWLPGSFNKVSTNLLTGAAGKADQWRIMATYLPVALYMSWQVDGVIPDMDAPKPRAGKKAAAEYDRVTALVNERRHHHALQAAESEVSPADLENMANERADRNYVQQYEAILKWCVAMRIWGSRSITVDDAWRAHECHMYSCQAWTRMLCHLTPYFHLLMHLILWVLRLGPAYVWWAFAYERFNGFLLKIHHNGHPGELEATMMCSWTKLHLIYDLILHLENLGDAKTIEDEESIKDLKACLHAPKAGKKTRGTLLTMLAAVTAAQSNELIVYPKHGRKLNLKHAGLYADVYEHLRKEWQGKVNLIPDTAPHDENGTAFIAVAIPMFSHVVVAGVRYGASTAQKGLSSRAADLGIDTWRARRLGEPQVLNTAQLSGHFALPSIEHRGRVLWVTMSLCWDSQEPDTVDDVQEDNC